MGSYLAPLSLTLHTHTCTHSLTCKVVSNMLPDLVLFLKINLDFLITLYAHPESGS